MTRIHAGAAAFLAATLALTSCSGDNKPRISGPTLRAPIDGEVGGEIPSAKPNAPVVIPMPNLCTTGSPITITTIIVSKPRGGLRLADWGTRRRHPGDPYSLLDNVGGADGLVSQFRGFGHHPVTGRCQSQAKGSVERTELDISIETSTARGSTTGITITYRAGSARRTLAVPYELTLCTSSNCPPPAPKTTPTAGN